MKKTLWMIVLMVAAIGVVGCSDSAKEATPDPDTAKEAVVAPASDSFEAMIQDQMVLMKEMVGVLEGVTDKETAVKAKPELDALNKKGMALKARADKLGKPSAEEEVTLKTKYEKQMEEVGGKMMAQMMRLSAKPEAMKVVQDSMAPKN
jgi:hypothetical protein